MQADLYETRNIFSNETKANLIKNSDKAINDKAMNIRKFNTEKLYKIVDAVLKILKLNKKILTPQQMLSRLPVSLAQLQAGNNS